MTREQLTRKVCNDSEDSGDKNIAELVFARGADPHRPLCPMGLVTPSALFVLDLDAAGERTKSPPIAGGALEQPAPWLDALRVVSSRRAIHQRRTLAAIGDAAKKG